MAESGEAPAFKWTDEHTRMLIQWRVANEALFTGKRNAAIKGFEVFVTEQNLVGKCSAPQIKRKWENLKQKYKDLKCPQTGVSTDDGEVTAATWKWYAAMDEAIGGRPSISPPYLIASSGPNVAVTSPSSARSAPERGRKRKDVGELILEMEEREAARERDATERDERRWREMMEREERRDRELRERDERRDRETKEREERLLKLLELIGRK